MSRKDFPMKQEDLRAARLIEAKRRWIEDETPRREVEHLADLYETCWTPRGYVVVPVEPTVAMIIAGATALKAGYGATPIYRAMLAALQPDRTPVDDPCRRLVRISGRDQRCDQPTPKEPE